MMHAHGRRPHGVWLAAVAALAIGGALVETGGRPAPGAAAQDFTAVKGKEPIPREPFKTWSLFLVTNQAWLMPDNARRIEDLYHRSRSFGRVIGTDHLAVWFWKKDGVMSGPGVADNVDVERAIALCQKLKLDPSGGPWLLFTTEYPDERTAPASFSAIQLDRSAEQIGQLLGRLGDQLLKEGLIKQGAFTQPVGSDDFWSAWFDATRHALSSLGANVRIAIRTPTLSIEAGGRPQG